MFELPGDCATVEKEVDANNEAVNRERREVKQL